MTDTNKMREETLRQFKIAYMEWGDKTDWVQDIATAKDLGKHRADVLREHFDRLKAENEALRKDAERYRWLLKQDESSAIDFIGYACESTARQQIDAAMTKEPINP